jgi:hypothetical protein
MDEMEQALNNLIRSTELSNREYHGQRIDEDIEMLTEIEESLNQLNFDTQRWAIVYLAYRWEGAQAKLHDDAPMSSAEASHNAQFVENFLRVVGRLPLEYVRKQLGEALPIVHQAAALWEQLDAIGQPWAIQHLILQYIETWRERHEDGWEC